MAEKAKPFILKKSFPFMKVRPCRRPQRRVIRTNSESIARAHIVFTINIENIKTTKNKTKHACASCVNFLYY
jgi:hypothetical protein